MAGEVSLCRINDADSRSGVGAKKETWLPWPTSTSTEDHGGEYSRETEVQNKNEDMLYGKDDAKGISDFICKQDLVAVETYMRRKRERQASLADCFHFLKLISFCKLF